MPRRWLAARTIARRPASAPRAHALSRPRDDPGVPRPARGMRVGGRQTTLPSHALRPPPPRVYLVPTPWRPRGAPSPGD
eukprot:84387-Prymnesium_polylepis.1